MYIQKSYVKSIESYQTGFKIELENWVNPETILKDVYNDSPEKDTLNHYIKYQVIESKLFVWLYVFGVDKVDI